LQAHREVADVYAAPGTPAAVIVGVDGRIAASLALGSEAIDALVTAELRSSSVAIERRVGAPLHAGNDDPVPLSESNDSSILTTRHRVRFATMPTTRNDGPGQVADAARARPLKITTKDPGARRILADQPLGRPGLSLPAGAG
jgi:hypothetical protein